MAGHPGWCHKVDDPRALALWKSKRPPLGTFWCGNHRHRLAKIYDLPTIGLAICLPAFRFKMDALELGTQRHGHTEDGHAHAALYPLADLPGDAQIGRCACGTYLMRNDRIREFGDGTKDMLAEWTAGRA